jgi:CheY-like chemotaxis protein/HPt (histidine-containing phosphotransfer) domain-containing protein
MLRGDPGRLRQILNNLTGNAIKFTPGGEVAIQVSLEEGAGGREQGAGEQEAGGQGAGEQETVLLRFSVRDSGIGIPKNKIGLLFDKFSQVDASTTRQYGGTGLGLAISKQLAELMGGEAGVDSEEGKGSEFWFTARFGKQAEDAYMESTLPGDLQNVRVLIVDDNATNCEILYTRLASWGMRPSVAQEGPVALQILYRAMDEKDPFRIAVIDMQMPGMDGETLGKIIQADKRMNDTRMVMLTSLGMRGDARRLEEIGFVAYATKPIRHQELKAVLSLAMGDRSKSTQRPITTRHTARETLNLFAGCKARILLAEDNITNQQVALGILKKLGLRADAVANGAEAIKALKTLPYDLVLMDVQMPEMDGIEATRRIRNRERKMMNDECVMMNMEEPVADDSHSSFITHHSSYIIPIIAMTAHAMQGDRDRCIEAGMNDYITKPVSPQSLAEVLDKWLPKENDDRCAEMVKDEKKMMNAECGMMNKEEPATDDSHSSLIIRHSSLIFDRAGMMARLMDDEDLARMVVEGFLNDIPLQIAALKGYLETGDAAGAERQAHTIKGASANVGGERLRDVAFEIEKTARIGDLNAAWIQMAELETQFHQLNRAMIDFIGQFVR